jgi:hypothetical protein
MICSFLSLIWAISFVGAQDDYADLLKVFNARFHGWSSHNTDWEIANSPTDGNGVYVSVSSPPRTVRKGDILMVIPLNESICRDSLEHAALLQDQKHRRQYQQGSNRNLESKDRHYYHIIKMLRDDQLLPLALLVERALGTLSVYNYWISLLPGPTQLQPPFMWTRKELSALEPISIRQQQAAKGTSIDHEFRQLNPVVSELKRYVIEQRHKSSHHLEPADVDDLMSAESFRLCVLWSWTRAWNMFGKKYFVPAADMFNHLEDDDERAFSVRYMLSASERSKKFTDYHQVVNSKTNPGAQNLIVRSDRSFTVRADVGDAAGGPSRQKQQIYESYGDNVNDIFFAYHGFVPDSNGYDCQPVLVELSRKKASHEFTELHGVFKQAAARGLRRPFPDGAYFVLGQHACVYRKSVPPQLLQLGVLDAIAIMHKNIASPDEQDAAQRFFSSCFAEKVAAMSVLSQPAYELGYLLLDHLVLCATNFSLQPPMGSRDQGRFDDRNLLHRALQKAEEVAEDGHQNQVKLVLSLMEDAIASARNTVLRHYKSDFSTSNTTRVEAILASTISSGEERVTAAKKRLLAATKLRLGRMRLLNALLAWTKRQLAAISAAKTTILARLSEGSSEL